MTPKIAMVLVIVMLVVAGLIVAVRTLVSILSAQMQDTQEIRPPKCVPAIKVKFLLNIYVSCYSDFHWLSDLYTSAASLMRLRQRCSLDSQSTVTKKSAPEEQEKHQPKVLHPFMAVVKTASTEDKMDQVSSTVLERPVVSELTP